MTWLDAEDAIGPAEACADYAARASDTWDAHHLVILRPDDLFPSHFVDGQYRAPTGSKIPTLADIVAAVHGGIYA